MNLPELEKLTEPFFRHVENCRKCGMDGMNFKPCAEAERLTEEIGRKADAKATQGGGDG